MNYVFCPSYASVFFALYLKNSGQAVSIITNNAGIRKYCDVAHINCIYYDYINVPVIRLYKMCALKKRIDNLLKEIAVQAADKFYLLDNSFDISAFYLAKEWAGKGNAYFNILGRKYNTYSENAYPGLSYWARNVLKYLFRILLGLDLVFLEINGSPVWGIDDKFLEKNGIKSFTPEKSLKEMQLAAMRENQVKLGEYDNLVCTDGDLSELITTDSLIAVHGNILKLPYKFAVKYHPRVQASPQLQKYEQLFQNCEELPDYIPAELLLNNIRKNMISVFSVSLISASRLGHLRAVSLLEMVQWKSQSYKEEIKSWLIKESDNKILFVKTHEELNQLLENS